MDVRILEMGKYDVSIPKTIEEASYSDCYFDWIKLTKVKEDSKKQAARNIFCYDELNKIKNNSKLNKKNNNSKNENDEEIIRHLQETMILVSSDEKNEESDFIDSKFLYISMINIPMWNEDVFQDACSYSESRSEIFEKIYNTIKEIDACRLYYSFDHCDYVLIANGTKISYKDYLSILCKLRRIKIKFKNHSKSINAIHDITTIYGFGNDYISEVNSKDSKDNSKENELDLIARISFKDLNDKNSVSSIEPSPIFCTDVIGRYDCMFIWKGITWEQINKINKILKEQNEKFFCYSLNLGTDVNLEENSEKDSDNEGKKHYDKDICALDLSRSKLLDEAKDKYNNLNKRLKEHSRIYNTPLSNHFYEIYCSISAMLKKDFSQYYLLSFYESFFSFFGFVLKITDIHKELNKDEENKTYEKIYEIYKKYFGFLNALTACTIHSERQFLQTDAYQLLYFDAPPKLIAFYTAIANKITNSFKNGNNKYTFLITPDFKEDIFVDSLTQDRTVGEENNILIIHIDEKSLYDVTSTIAIITHEIFHHIGQDEGLRKMRAERVMKCCLAYVISNAIDINMLKKENRNKYVFKFFKDITNGLYNKIFGNVIGDKKDDNYYYYYFSNVVDSFYEDIGKELMSKDDFNGKIISFFRLQFCGVKNDANPKDWVTAQKTAKDIIWEMYMFLHSDDPLDLFSEVKHMFRESFADFCMLELLAETEDKKIDLYYDMLTPTQAYDRNDEIPRIVAVLESLVSNGDSKVQAAEKTDHCKKMDDLRLKFKSKIDKDDWKDTIELFYYYMEEETICYLKEVKENLFSNNDNDKSIVNELVKVLETLNNRGSSEIVAMMDKEIFEYRQRLLK